jgi:hypothetical protein
MEVTEPCLVLRRRTRSQGQVASVSALWHPASRYQFAGSLTRRPGCAAGMPPCRGENRYCPMLAA